jgi:hypothetical protein
MIGAVVGAIVGAWANSWHRGREAKKAEDQDRYALLLLMHAELHHNEFILIELIDDAGRPLLDASFKFQTDTWINSRVRLAQLLSKDHILALAAYYSWLDTFSEVLNDNQMPLNEKIEEVQGFAAFTLHFSNVAKQFGARYISDDPDFDPAVHAAPSSPDLDAAIRWFVARYPGEADTEEASKT